VRFILLDQQLLLTVQVFDEYNKLVLKIWDNELVYHPDPWDIEFVGRRLILREAARRILLDMTFEVPNKVSITRGRLLCNGVEILVRPDKIVIPGEPVTTTIAGSIKANQGGGIVIGPHPFAIGSLIRIDNMDRYKKPRSDTEAWQREVFDSGDTDGVSEGPANGV
jgi:trigger factor